MALNVRAKGQLAASSREDACHLFIRFPSDERLGAQACGCTVSECDGLTFGTVVSVTAQDHSVTTDHIVEEAAGGCADSQTAPKV